MCLSKMLFCYLQLRLGIKDKNKRNTFHTFSDIINFFFSCFIGYDIGCFRLCDETELHGQQNTTDIASVWLGDSIRIPEI